MKGKKKIKEGSFFLLSKRALSPASKKDPILGTNTYGKSRKGKVKEKTKVLFFFFTLTIYLSHQLIYN